MPTSDPSTPPAIAAVLELLLGSASALVDADDAALGDPDGVDVGLGVELGSALGLALDAGVELAAGLLTAFWLGWRMKPLLGSISGVGGYESDSVWFRSLSTYEISESSPLIFSFGTLMVQL